MRKTTRNGRNGKNVQDFASSRTNTVTSVGGLSAILSAVYEQSKLAAERRKEAGNVATIPAKSPIRDETLEWMDPDTTRWDHRMRNIIGGKSWAKTQVPRIVVEMNAITYEIVWPQNAERPVKPSAGYRFFGDNSNKIEEVERMLWDKAERNRWLWGVGGMTSDALSPATMLSDERIEAYSVDVEVETVTAARQRYKASLRRQQRLHTPTCVESERREKKLQKLFTKQPTTEEERGAFKAARRLSEKPSSSTATGGGARVSTGGPRKPKKIVRRNPFCGKSSQKPSPADPRPKKIGNLGTGRSHEEVPGGGRARWRK